MIPLERLTKFRNELADLCEKYDIELDTETDDRIGARPAESAMDCAFDFPPNSTPYEIRNAQIQL